MYRETWTKEQIDTLETGSDLHGILKLIDPLPKHDGITNYDLLKYEVGPLMLHLRNDIGTSAEVPVFWIDLFSGAGGTTTGIHLAGNRNMRVVACVNHDPTALLSHKANHPECIHLVEDVRDMKVVLALKRIVDQLRKTFPGCVINGWSSLECTNYSKAKGGLPRDADSRTLAHAMYTYLEQLQLDYMYIENVREFMAWGPLDDQGRPVSKLNGRDYLRWIKVMKSYGYDYDYQILNAADFGAYTSRERYFGQFAKKGLPIKWPEPTHSKKPTNGLFEAKKKWMPVRDVLDLEDEGESIFTRKKPLSENTLKRIYAGLVKFVAGGEDTITMVYNSGNDFQRVKSINDPVGSQTTQNSHAVVKSCFLQQRNSGNPNSKVLSINGPARTITSTGGNQEVVQAQFLMKNYSGHPQSKVKDLESPAGTITCIDHHSIVQSSFLSHYYGNGFNTSMSDPCPTITTKERVAKIDASFLLDYQYKSNAHHLDNPCPTLLTKDKLAKTDVKFMDQQFGNSKSHDLNQPTGTVTANPKQNLVHTKPWIMDTNFRNTGSDLNKPLGVITANRKWHYLMNPSWGGHASTIDQPSPVIIARQDKAPMYNVSANGGKSFAMPFFEQENETMQKIRLFMLMYGIVDIKMRMLKIPELLKIQGFPENYKLKGTKTDQKKFIGNAVETHVAKAITTINYIAIQLHLQLMSSKLQPSKLQTLNA